jgi:predicted GNAT family N-acyltransferase
MSVPNITSQEQYDALLPGTKYRRPDGQIKTKSGSAPIQAKPLDGFLSGLRAAGTAVRAGSGLINPAVTLGAGALTDYAADVIEEPVKTLVTDPAMAVYDMPSNIQKSGALGGGALAALATGRPAVAGRLGKQAALTGLEAAGGAAELAGLAPAIGPLAKTGVAAAKGIIKAPGQVYRGTRRAFGVDSPSVPTKSISDDIAKQVGTADEVTPIVDDAVDVTEELMPTSRIAEQSLEKIKNNAKVKNVKLDVYENNDTINVSRIVVPEKQKGTGTSIMNEIIDYADNNSKTITLTPSTDFGATSVTRLKNFYKRFGFVENKGANKNFKFRDTMYRDPSKPQELMPTSAVDDAVGAAQELMPPSLIPQGKEQNIYDYMRSVSGIKDPKEFRSSLLRAADDETVRPDMLLQDPNLPGYRIAGVGLGRRAGPSQNIMQKAARAQQSEQSQRVNEAFNVALGRPKDMIDTLDDINIRIDEESKPLYDKAFAKGIQPTEELQEVLNIPLVKDYRDKAVKDLAYMGQETENQLEILHQVKKSLDDEIGRNIQQNTPKRARDLIIIKNKLLKEIDKANPEYAQARKIFAGEEANKYAMDYGLKNITNKKTRPKQFARDIENYSKSEKEALLSGIKDQIDILLDNPESYSALKGQFRTPSFKAKLETVIGKEKAETLVNDLVRQAELADAAKATDVGANSITASSTEAIKLAEQPAKSDTMQAIAKGTEAVGDVRNLANLIPFLGRKAGDLSLRTLGKAGDVVDEDITTAAAQLLTMPTRDAAQMLLDLDIDVRKKISGRLLDNSQGVKILRALPKQSALTALGGLAGAGVVSATTPNIVNITTQQQYDRLPAGTRYRRSDGQIRTKN